MAKQITSHLLDLGQNLVIDPDLLIGNGNGIFVAGAQGAGKTVVLKRMLEQIALKANVPLVAFDREDDLEPLLQVFPRGVLATYANCPTATDIYRDGLQVVFALSSWPSMDVACQMISRLVTRLMDEAGRVPFGLRVPLVVALDEAAYFTPQNARHSLLDANTLAELNGVFETLALRGRKRGLVPLLATQWFSNVAKNVLSPGTYILLQQNRHTEQVRYLDYIVPVDEFRYYTDRQRKQRIADLHKGEAIVKLANGEQRIVQFHPCQSEHLAHTPSVAAARSRYGSIQFQANRTYGAYIEDEEMEMPGREPALTPAIVSAGFVPVVQAEQPQRKKRTTAKPSIVEARIRAILAEQPGLTSSELGKLAHCSFSDAKRWLERLANEQQTVAPPVAAPDVVAPVKRAKHTPAANPQHAIERQIFALLEQDSSLSPMELAKKSGCDLEEAKQVRALFYTPIVRHGRALASR